MFHLSSKLDSRFIELRRKSNNKSPLNFKLVFKKSFLFLLGNYSLLILTLVSFYNLYLLAANYSFLCALLSPLKFWFLLLAFYLSYKCTYIPNDQMERTLNSHGINAHEEVETLNENSSFELEE